ncbi:MAG: hypothetical protein ACRDRK_07185 [Pseudonocardia sp.]
MCGNPGSGLGLLRATALAALCTLLTAMGHVAGGGSIPDIAVLVVLFPLLAGVPAARAQRCASVTGTVVTLAAGQLGLHHLLVLLHPSHHETGPAPLNGTGMLALHATTTLIMAVLVRHADRALVALTAALRRMVPRRLAVVAVDVPLPALPVPGPAVPARRARAFAASALRRGPPVAG